MIVDVTLCTLIGWLCGFAPAGLAVGVGLVLVEAVRRVHS